MNKPTAYLPFYGNDFFQAISGYPPAVGLGYLRALWHYWHHTGCEGLPDDDEYLRRMCGCSEADWPSTCAVLFDNRYNFKLEDGLWHQARCRVEFHKSLTVYAKRSAAGKRGMQKRWHGEDAGDNKAITPGLTKGLTENNNHHHHHLHSHNQ